MCETLNTVGWLVRANAASQLGMTEFVVHRCINLGQIGYAVSHCGLIITSLAQVKNI